MTEYYLPLTINGMSPEQWESWCKQLEEYHMSKLTTREDAFKAVQQALLTTFGSQATPEHDGICLKITNEENQTVIYLVKIDVDCRGRLI